MDNREATITFEVLGETRDSLIANVARIDRLIEVAKTFSIEEAWNRVELQYAWDGNSQTTYFEVVERQAGMAGERDVNRTGPPAESGTACTSSPTSY